MVKKILSIIFLIGQIAALCLALYPTFSNKWNQAHQSYALASYQDKVLSIDEDEYDRMWAAAVAYNEKLAKNEGRWHPTEEEIKEYNSLLDVTGTGIMGSVEIPARNISLPIYHGTDEAILQTAIGHMEGSSLPVGGANTHCAISGHRGLPSAKLFTDIDELKKGDTFYLQVLDQTLTYEIDQILTVLPEQMEALDIEKGKDYCTLITCTPYGINSHRLLVRGHRIANEVQNLRVKADGLQLDTLTCVGFAAFPAAAVLVIWLFVRRIKKIIKRRQERQERRERNETDNG